MCQKSNNWEMLYKEQILFFLKQVERLYNKEWWAIKVECLRQTRSTWNKSHNAWKWTWPYKNIKKPKREKPQLTPFKTLPSSFFGEVPPRSNELPPKPQHQVLSGSGDMTICKNQRGQRIKRSAVMVGTGQKRLMTLLAEICIDLIAWSRLLA